MKLGCPRLHLREIDSTNSRARELAARGAPHGTLVTAAVQTSGRGRQGRSWTAPAGRALLCSVLIREPPRLLPLAAGLAVAEVVNKEARLKWPNDVLLGGRKLAGILVEGRPQEGWAVTGIGVNVAVRQSDFPAELRDRAGTMGLEPSSIEPTLERLMRSLERWLSADAGQVLDAMRARDALRDKAVSWSGGAGGGGGAGRGGGIDAQGRLIVLTDGGRVALDAGEVHLEDGLG